MLDFISFKEFLNEDVGRINIDDVDVEKKALEAFNHYIGFNSFQDSVYSYFNMLYDGYEMPNIYDLPDSIIIGSEPFGDFLLDSYGVEYLEDIEDVDVSEIASKFRDFYEEDYRNSNIDELRDFFNDFDDDDELLKIKGYRNWILYEFEANIENNIDNIKDVYENINGKDYIPIYRAMGARNDWEDWVQNLGSGTHVGIYWSFDPSGAQVYWSDNNKNSAKLGKSEIIMKSMIDVNLVDWDATIELMGNRDLYEMEQEIRLFKGTKLTLLGLCDSNGNIIDNKVEGVDVVA